jgi:tRNA threonylcarbamoyladenosine biosynthesis protein TsaB
LVLVIDTSSARAAVALLHPGGGVEAERVVAAGPGLDLPALLAGLLDPSSLTLIAVATGPGSFTGIRVGVSYGLGLALARRLPILGLGTLELAAARAGEPALALSEAGRGRVYRRLPGGPVGLAEPAELPRTLPAVGWLREGTARAVAAAGIRLLEEGELRSFGAAAAGQVEGADEAAYGRLRIEYMSSVGELR